MTKQTINIGTADRGDGDPIRTAFQKVNANFTELYTALGLGDNNLNLGSFEFTNNVMTTTDSSNIIIDQNVVIRSELTMQGDIVPNVANEHNLGSPTHPWGSLYVSNNTIYIGGNALKIDGNGDLTLNNNRIVQENGEYLVLDNLTDVSANSPSVGDVLTWNGGSWVNGGQVDLGKFKIANNILGTVDNPNTGGWGGYDLQIDPGGASAAGILIPSVSGQAGGTALQIYNLGNAASVLSLWGRGNVQVVTGQGITEKVFTFEGDSLFFPDGSLALTDSVLNNGLDADIKGSVFADDSTLMIDAVDNKIYAAELTVAVGNFVNINSNNVDVENINGLSSQINFTVGGYNNLVIENNLVTIQNVSLSVAGDITLGGDIRSEGNINIEINLSDSTLRRWSFGEDGILNTPYDIILGNNGSLKTYNVTGGGDDGADFFITTPTNPNRSNACNILLQPGESNGTASLVGHTYLRGGDSALLSLDAGDVRISGGLNYGGGSNGVVSITSILKIEDGVHELFQTKADATGTVTHDCSSGHVFYHTSPDANWTANFTNLNLSSTYATAVTLIIVQGGIGYYPNAVQIGGVSKTIHWQGNATPTPSSNRTDVVTFSIINNSGTYTVLGQLTGF